MSMETQRELAAIQNTYPVIEVMENGRIKIETYLTPEDLTALPSSINQLLQEIVEIELTERGREGLVYVLKALDQFSINENSIKRVAQRIVA